MLKESMGLLSKGLPSALWSAATFARGMSPRKQVTSVQRLGRGLGHANSNMVELIPSAPTRTSPVATKPFEKVAVDHSLGAFGVPTIEVDAQPAA
jgi:hypothetical protein